MKHEIILWVDGSRLTPGKFSVQKFVYTCNILLYDVTVDEDNDALISWSVTESKNEVEWPQE